METIEEIIRGKTGRALMAFTYSKVKDKAIAQDIVQEVFVKVYSRLGQLKDDKKITGWIYQIARNTIADHFRASAKTMPANDLDWGSDHQALNECAAYCLREMLLTLPLKYREALELTEFENLSQTQLATRLNISYSGAKSRVQRAKRMLRERMEQNYRIKFDHYGNVVQCENKVPCNCSGRFVEAYD